MANKRHKPEEIVQKLRQVDVLVGQGIQRASLILFLMMAPAVTLADEVKAYLFWSEGCPFCERAITALKEISADDPELNLLEVQIGISDQNDSLYGLAVQRLGIGNPAVPLFVVGDAAVIGFSESANSARRYRALIEGCRATRCRNAIDLRLEELAAASSDTQVKAELPESVELPFLGEIDLRNASLPALTVVLAAVDGFNPCAMWVLAILIGFLLGVEDRWRMWTLGLVFLATTAVMYFAIMAAWLNVMLWIGALWWLRWAVGGIAVVAGLHYLNEYWNNPEGICRVTPSAQRKTLISRFRAIVDEPSLLLAALGIAALAIVVNLIELVCSAGVPVVFTQMLTMHDLSVSAHYGYLALYIAVFLLDDAAIFAFAMVTMRSVAASGRFARLSHLIGGIVLIALGAVLALRPDLLG